MNRFSEKDWKLFRRKIVGWQEAYMDKLNKEYSKYYFLDSSNTIKHKENTTLNNKGDNFFHSVVVKTELFDEFDFTTSLPENNLIGIIGKSDRRFRELKAILDEFLYSVRKPYIREYANKYINSCFDIVFQCIAGIPSVVLGLLKW